LVERVGLGQVQDVERDLGRLVRLVDYLEVVPLRVAFGVDVILEPQVVLHIVDFARLAQITRLKPTIEDQLIVQHRHLKAILDPLHLASPHVLSHYSSIHLLFQVCQEVPVPYLGLALELRFCLLCLCEQDAFVDFRVKAALLIVGLDTLRTAFDACVAIIDQNSAELHLFLWGFDQRS
jgi:hypothetical protein